MTPPLEKLIIDVGVVPAILGPALVLVSLIGVGTLVIYCTTVLEESCKRARRDENPAKCDACLIRRVISNWWNGENCGCRRGVDGTSKSAVDHAKTDADEHVQCASASGAPRPTTAAADCGSGDGDDDVLEHVHM